MRALLLLALLLVAACDSAPLPDLTDPPPDDTTAPTVTITAPQNGGTLRATGDIFPMAYVTFAAEDAGGLLNIELLMDGVSVGGQALFTPEGQPTTATGQVGFRLDGVAEGPHLFRLAARDVAYNRGVSQAVTLVVDND